MVTRSSFQSVQCSLRLTLPDVPDLSAIPALLEKKKKKISWIFTRQQESANARLDADGRKYQGNDSGQNPTAKAREASDTQNTFRSQARVVGSRGDVQRRDF